MESVGGLTEVGVEDNMGEFVGDEKANIDWCGVSEARKDLRGRVAGAEAVSCGHKALPLLEGICCDLGFVLVLRGMESDGDAARGGI